MNSLQTPLVLDPSSVVRPADPALSAALAALQADRVAISGVSPGLETALAALGAAASAAPGWRGPARDLFESRRAELAGRLSAVGGQLENAVAELVSAAHRLRVAV